MSGRADHSIVLFFTHLEVTDSSIGMPLLPLVLLLDAVDDVDAVDPPLGRSIGKKETKSSKPRLPQPNPLFSSPAMFGLSLEAG
jgi:hypothetical protein